MYFYLFVFLIRILFLEIPCVIHNHGIKVTSSIIHFSKQKKYKEEAEKTRSHYNAVLDTPEMQRVRENQKNFSTVRLFFFSKSLVTVFILSFVPSKLDLVFVMLSLIFVFFVWGLTDTALELLNCISWFHLILSTSY